MGDRAVADGVKSASRAMAILELFRDTRRALGAREIAAALLMPRSSTNVLLRSLIVDGYLRYDDVSSAYFPTLRVYQLGAWLLDDHLHSPDVDAVMRELAGATSETVCLWTRAGATLTVVSVVESPQAIALSIRAGATAPLFGSAVGHAFIMRMEPSLVDALRERALRGSRSDRTRNGAPREIARHDGEIAVGYELWQADAAAACGAFFHPAVGEDAVLAVGGPVFRIRRHEEGIVTLLASALAQLRDCPSG